MDDRYRITTVLNDSTAVCGPAGFSLKDDANRDKLRKFIIDQLYPDDLDGWRAALSVFAVPVWNSIETEWYVPREISGYAPKIRKMQEYSAVQQHALRCRLCAVLDDLRTRAGSFAAVTQEQRLLVSCLSDPSGVFGFGRAVYFAPDRDLYVVNDSVPVVVRWGVVTAGTDHEPALKKFFSTCGMGNSEDPYDGNYESETADGQYMAERGTSGTGPEVTDNRRDGNSQTAGPSGNRKRSEPQSKSGVSALAAGCLISLVFLIPALLYPLNIVDEVEYFKRSQLNNEYSYSTQSRVQHNTVPTGAGHSSGRTDPRPQPQPEPEAEQKSVKPCFFADFEISMIVSDGRGGKDLYSYQISRQTRDSVKFTVRRNGRDLRCGTDTKISPDEPKLTFKPSCVPVNAALPDAVVCDFSMPDCMTAGGVKPKVEISKLSSCH